MKLKFNAYNINNKVLLYNKGHYVKKHNVKQYEKVYIKIYICMDMCT